MESIHQQSVTSEAPEEVTKPVHGFPSEEAMQTYYLQMAEIMGIRCRGERSEDNSIRNLYHRLKQFANTLQYINTHEWERGIAEIQNAAGAYMMQDNIDCKKLLQTNNEIGLHLQFIARLAGSAGFLRQLQGIIIYHLQNVEYLVKNIKV